MRTGGFAEMLSAMKRSALRAERLYIALTTPILPRRDPTSSGRSVGVGAKRVLEKGQSEVDASLPDRAHPRCASPERNRAGFLEEAPS
jgi:hypothetical protein